MEGCWPKPPSQRPNEVAIKPYHTHSCHRPKKASKELLVAHQLPAPAIQLEHTAGRDAAEGLWLALPYRAFL